MEIDFFLSRFKSKTNKELEDIINATGGYVPAAVEAAGEILKKRQVSGKFIEAPSPGAEILRKRKNSPHPFDPMPYLKSFGKKDLFTILAVSMFIQAITQFSRYYNFEPDLNLPKNIITAALITLAMLLAHFFYKKDHNRSNNYLGRCINDTLMFLALSGHIVLYDVIANQGYFYPFFEDAGGVLAFTISFFFIALAFEGLVSLFKYIFKSSKWEIL